MGLTVALNANAMVRSSVKSCLMFAVMVHLSWELTLVTCIEIPLMALMQNKYIKLSTVGGDCRDSNSRFFYHNSTISTF